MAHRPSARSKAGGWSSRRTAAPRPTCCWPGRWRTSSASRPPRAPRSSRPDRCLGCRRQPAIGQDVMVLNATLAVLTVLLVTVAILLALAALQARARRDRGSGPRPAPPVGSPAQVWLERGERVAQRLRRLGAEHPALTGVADDADTVLAELRAVAAEVAALDAATTRLTVPALQAEQRRLDDAIAAAGDGPARADLRSARAAVAARLALA